ncbi:hypothetical protein J4449_00980 [Candidatus Woesearchaeota archaeon]|nr:hypothetical protein [Candidatus Woesearchaeota archaeon]
MAHITLSIPDAVYEQMKKHPEIKWSEVARQSIIKKTLSLRNHISGKELLKLLPLDVQNSIKSADEKESIGFYKKMKEKEWKRKKYLTQA